MAQASSKPRFFALHVSLPSLYYTTMPPQRIPLAELMANRPYGPEYSPYTRGKIAGLYIAGLTQRKIIDLTNVSRQGVRGSIALEILNTNRASLPRPGRPIIYYPRDKRIMLRTLRF
jgi:hypothetical protein